MDSIREKLVELMIEAKKADTEDAPFSEFLADFMIAHGVTIQQWIPVSDRLPEESGLCITFGCTAVPVRWLHNFDKDIGKFGSWWNYEPDGKKHPRYRFIEAGNISHWAPLPTPPKGVSGDG